jgi:hypothetical protein
VSSSKLQPCLELCRFIQAPLKTKVARWKTHFLLRVCEKTSVQHSSEWMAYYSRCTTRKKGCCPWSHVATTSHILSLTLTASLRMTARSLSLFVSNPCLTFLGSNCTSSTPNPVYSLVHVYHRAMLLWFHQYLHITVVP